MNPFSRIAAAHPFVVIAVPTLNEAQCIADCLNGLLAQDYAGPFEIMVLDGGSTDATCAIVEGIAAMHGTVRLVHNPGRLQSAACNLAAALAPPCASILVRADAHSVYPRDYVRLCVAALREHGATSVVVPMRAVGAAGLQTVIAATQNSWLGNGASAHRGRGRDGFIDHGHHAAFDLDFFRLAGGYDERFSHNEDAELDYRMARRGGRIWMCSAAAVDYLPRNRLSRLARQYFNHGRGRARMLLLHGVRPRPRQMAPVAFLLGSLGGLAVSAVTPWAALLPAGYAALCASAGLAAAVRARRPTLLGMGPVAMVMHLSWGLGAVYAVAANTVGPAVQRLQPWPASIAS